MIFSFIPKAVARLYLGALLALGLAAYAGGVVTADVCSAHASGTIVASAKPSLC